MAWALVAWAVVTVALTAFSIYAAQKAMPPDEVTGNSRKLSTSSDAESPWKLVYGDRVTGGHVAWAGVTGGDQETTGIDYILASHSCEAVLAVQAGNLYLPIVTNAAASEGLILNANRSPTDSSFPTDWYVPVVASAWFRKDQAQNTSDKKSHIGIKFYYGTQTATDAHMASVFGAKYTDAGARKFIGHTVAHVIFRAHDELGTLSGVPSMQWRIQGKNDIALNDAGSSTGYTANAAAVLADAMKMFDGVPASEIANHAGGGLASLITECATTAWDPLGTAARYEYDDEIRYDEEPTEVYARIAKHMMGGFSERGDKVVFWTGTARNPVMTLTVDDFAGPARTEPVADDDWVNGYVPHRVVRTALDDDGNTVLHGEMRPARKASQAAYVTEDGGVELIQDIHFEGCDLGRRAQDLAHIALDTLRIGSYYARYTRKYRKRALVLEVGDVFSATDPTRLASATEFRCIAKSAPDENWDVEITGTPYADALYDQRAVEDDEVGVRARGRSPFLPALAGLGLSIVDGSDDLQPNGKIKVSLEASWDAITLAHARAGDVQWSWKRTNASWPGRSAQGAADETSMLLGKFVHGNEYDFRARILATVETAGRASRRARGDWTYLLNQTITSQFLELPSGPGTGVTGANQVYNGNFERGDDGSWELVSGGPQTATGSAAIETTGGKYGPLHARITITSAAIGDKYHIRNDIFMPVSAGEWKRVLVGTRRGGGLATFRALVNAIFYDGQDPPQSVGATRTVIFETITNNSYLESRLNDRFQVPGDGNIVWCRLQLGHEALSSGAQQSTWDGLALHDMTVMRSTRQTTQVNRTDDTWTNLATLDDFPDGPTEPDIYFDGETTVTVTAYVYASVQHTTGTKLTERSRAVARLSLEEVGVGTTSIVTQTMIARMWPSETDASAEDDDYDSGESTEVEVRRLETTLTPTEGHYKVHLEGRLVGDGTNARAQFHDRWIRIVKD